MKKAKKILTLVACAVLLVCISVGATIAYLTAITNEVKNTFTVGDVGFHDDPTTENIKEGLTEAKVDEYGNPLKADGTKLADHDAEYDTYVDNTYRVNSNKYKLVPGHKYVKDPTVTIAAQSEECYVRMIVTITDLVDVKAVFGTDEETGFFLPQYFVEGWDSTKWITKGVVENEDKTEATYEFWYYDTVDTLYVDDPETDKDESKNTLTLEPLFTHIVVPGTVSDEQLAYVKEMNINVIAHAIQADGFEDAADAWENWDNTETN